MLLFTIGHSTHGTDAFLALLHEAGIEHVVDVRTAPGSRRHPHFARAQMEAWLPAAGIGYRWEPDLGGLRRARPGSLNGALRNESFRAYADHMHSHAFEAAFDALAAEAERLRTAVMCAEALWWRCHRKMISDFAVLARGLEVRHVFPDGRIQPHPPMPEARLEGAFLIYDRAQTPGLFDSAPSGGSRDGSENAPRPPPDSPDAGPPA